MRSFPAGARARNPGLGRSESTLYAVAVVAAMMLTVYPLFALAHYAASGSAAPFAAMASVLGDPHIRTATWNSLQLAAGTTLLATAIGVALALIVTRTNTPFGRIIAPIGVLPLLTMPFVGAVAWSLLASPRAGLLNVLFRKLTGISMELGPLNILSMPGMIWVMGLYYSPYAYILTSGALRSLDSSMEEASRLCGASPARVLWHTTIPLVRPAILSAAFLIFSFSAGQFSIPQIIGIPARIDVLSTVIFAEAQTYPRDFSRLMGIGLLLLVIAAGTLVLQRLWLRRGNYEVVAGKGTRSQLLDLGRWRYAVLGITIIYLLIMLVLPLLALAYSSFQRFSSTEFRPDLLTWANYARVLSDTLTITSIANSLVLATVSASLCLTLGLIMSYMIHRTHLRGRGVVNLLAMLPIGIPGIVLGTGILAAYISPPLVLYGTLGILVVGYVAHSLPTASQASAAGLVQIGRELEESARVSGASWIAMVRRILLPLMRPAMIGTWLLLFITQFRELDTSILLYTPGHEVVSVALLNLWEAGSYNPVAAFSVIVTIISLAVFVLMQIASGQRRVVLAD